METKSMFNHSVLSINTISNLKITPKYNILIVISPKPVSISQYPYTPRSPTYFNDSSYLSLPANQTSHTHPFLYSPTQPLLQIRQSA